ncbi:MAG TPA: signal peptidase I [Polyangiaceae bacterium]
MSETNETTKASSSDLRKAKVVLWPVWFLLLPLALAWLTVKVLSPGEGFNPTTILDKLLWYIGDQRVPATIGFFTLYEMLVYHYRHVLPLAGPTGRDDMPKEALRAYEQAAQLLDESDRILRKHRPEIESSTPAPAREELSESLQGLRRAMSKTPFDVGLFDDSHERAARLFQKHLGRFRKGELREYAESIFVAIGVALLLRAFVIEAFKIPSGSMLPTLQIQDHIFVNKLAYGPQIPFTSVRLWESLPPKRGDVLVFVYPDTAPDQPSQDFIKRAIALPGDTLLVEGGHPIINGWRVPSCRVGPYEYREGASNPAKRGDLFVEFLGEVSYLTLFEDGRTDGEQGPYYVKAGETWVLGDNRNNSSDSRAWYGGRGGGVPDANLKGRALFVWWGDPLSDRLFVNVMGEPELPKAGATPEIIAGIKRCLASRPPVSMTTPPPPAAGPPAQPSTRPAP